MPIKFDHLPKPGGTWVCGCAYEIHASLDDTYSVMAADRCRRYEGIRDEHAVHESEAVGATEAGGREERGVSGAASGGA